MQDLNNLRRNLGSLSDMSDEILTGSPIVSMHGLHDNCQYAPAFHRHF